MENILRKRYERMELFHCSASLLSSIDSSPERRKIYFMFHHRQLSIAVVAGQALILYNTFEYSSKDDILYYVFFTDEQLEMDPNDFLTFARCKINSQHEIYELLCRYIRHVECEKHEPIFEALPKASQEYYYFLSLLQCVSSRES